MLRSSRAFDEASASATDAEFSPDGRWLLPGPPPEDRQWLWLAGSLLADGDAADRQWAEALIVAAVTANTAVRGRRAAGKK